MAEASGHTSKQEMAKINNALNLTKNEVADALTGVPQIENNCTTMDCVKDGKMFVEIVDARTKDIEKRRARGGKEYTIISILHSSSFSMCFTGTRILQKTF